MVMMIAVMMVLDIFTKLDKNLPEAVMEPP